VFARPLPREMGRRVKCLQLHVLLLRCPRRRPRRAAVVCRGHARDARQHHLVVRARRLRNPPPPPSTTPPQNFKTTSCIRCHGPQPKGSSTTVRPSPRSRRARFKFKAKGEGVQRCKICEESLGISGGAHAAVTRRPPISLSTKVPRTPRTFGMCPSFKDHSLSRRAKPCRCDSPLLHRCKGGAGGSAGDAPAAGGRTWG
jgi:hypothetical protein